MPNHWYHEIMSMLKDAGAIELPHGGGHYKYRLPNGRLFVFPKTPSHASGVANSLATLRRELRHTHPEIAQRGRSLSKEKMAMYVNPGEKPQPIRSHAIHPDAQPQGFYSFSPGTPIIFDNIKTPEPLDHFTMEPKPPIRIEDNEMSSMLDRARHALEEVKKRLASYNEQINQLKISQDADLEKQIKLEDYIQKQEALANEATELLDFGVIPREQPVPVAVKARSGRKVGVRIPLELVTQKIFPDFKMRFNGKGFSAGDFAEALYVRGIAADRKTCANWLSNYLMRKDVIAQLQRVEKGRYGFKPMDSVE